MVTVDAPDTVWISQRSPNETVGVEIYRNGVLADPDGQAVTVMFTPDGSNTPIFTRQATRDDVGKYSVVFSAAVTQTIGRYTLAFNFEFDGLAVDPIVFFVDVGAYSPAWLSLDTNMRMVVEHVWDRFADGFDSPVGGPNLQTYFQTRFSRGRLAQLLRVAVGKLNSVSQPYQTYTVEGDNQFPVEQWGYLLEQALYVETIKHLIRSYVEQPVAEGVPTARLDRRDYMDRWGTVLGMEEDDLKDALEVFKIANMTLSSPRVLVSGGVYGNFGPTRTPGSVAQPRYWARFYVLLVVGLALGSLLWRVHPESSIAQRTSGRESIALEVSMPVGLGGCQSRPTDTAKSSCSSSLGLLTSSPTSTRSDQSLQVESSITPATTRRSVQEDVSVLIGGVAILDIFGARRTKRTRERLTSRGSAEPSRRSVRRVIRTTPRTPVGSCEVSAEGSREGRSAEVVVSATASAAIGSVLRPGSND